MELCQNLDSELERMLVVEENVLSGIGRRLGDVEAFQGELDRATKGKPFAIRNAVVWTMVIDWRDALVTHFASWIRGMYENGGFLRQIQAHHLRALRRKWRTGEETRPREWLHQLLAKNHFASFERLFPDVKTAFPKPNDVELVRSRFVEAFKSVVGDRDSNRAHPYEEEHAKNAKMLDLRELRQFVSQAEAFLGDFRLVSFHSSFGYPKPNRTDSQGVMSELVDLILLGTERRRGAVLCGRSRDEYYHHRHAKHDLLTREPKPLFNGNW